MAAGVAEVAVWSNLYDPTPWAVMFGVLGAGLIIYGLFARNPSDHRYTSKKKGV